MAETPDKKEEEPQGTSKKKLIIIGAIAGVVVIGIGVGAFLFLKGGSTPKEEHPAAAEGEHGEKPEGEPAAGGEHGEAPKEGEKKDEHGKPEEHGKTDEHGKPAEHGAEEAKEGGHGEAAKPAEKKKEDEGATINFGATYPFKPFHINLGNPLENRYIRVEISIEYKNGEDQLKEIEARKAQLRDAIIAVISRKTREFLLGPDGKDQIRLELLNRINQYMERKIDGVYITDLLIE